MPALHTSALVARARASVPRQVADASRSRRRRTLLKLAERHGEVRVLLREEGRPALHAADVLELLDELNASARLRWGGLHSTGTTSEVVYLKPSAKVAEPT